MSKGITFWETEIPIGNESFPEVMTVIEGKLKPLSNNNSRTFPDLKIYLNLTSEGISECQAKLIPSDSHLDKP